MIYSWSELCLSRIEVFMIHSRLLPASPDGTRRAHMHTGIAQYALGRSHPPAAAYIPHLLQALHSVQVSPVGVFLMMEYRAGSFITSDTGQAILQKARFFRKIKARGTAVA